MTLANSKIVLSDVCEAIIDCEHKTAPTQSEGHPSIRTPNIGRGRLILDGVNRVSDETYKTWTQRMEPQAGDLILAREAPVGNVAIIPRCLKVCLGQRTVLIRPNRRKVLAEYLVYLMLGDEIQGRVQSLSNGATVHHLNMKDIRNLQLPTLPDLEEQRRIASILSAYDDLIENNTRRIAILEEMARRIYEEWFVRFRFPGHESVRMIESELGPVPEGWEAVRMEDVCVRITDGSHRSPKSIEVGKPMASVKDMHDWGINIATCRQIDESEYEELVRNDCKPRLNDVLIAKDGSYLKHTFVVDEEKDIVVLSSIAILRPNGRMLPNQLAMYLRQPDVVSRMKGYVSGVAIPRIVLRDFRQFLVLLAPEEMQHAWAALCDPMLSLCRNLVRQNESLRVTRDLLLPKLISGELDVSELPIPEAAAA